MSAHGLYVMAAYGLSALALLITIGWIAVSYTHLTLPTNREV